MRKHQTTVAASAQYVSSTRLLAPVSSVSLLRFSQRPKEVPVVEEPSNHIRNTAPLVEYSREDPLGFNMFAPPNGPPASTDPYHSHSFPPSTSVPPRTVMTKARRARLAAEVALAERQLQGNTNSSEAALVYSQRVQALRAEEALLAASLERLRAERKLATTRHQCESELDTFRRGVADRQQAVALLAADPASGRGKALLAADSLVGEASEERPSFQERRRKKATVDTEGKASAVGTGSRPRRFVEPGAFFMDRVPEETARNEDSPQGGGASQRRSEQRKRLAESREDVQSQARSSSRNTEKLPKSIKNSGKATKKAKEIKPKKKRA